MTDYESPSQAMDAGITGATDPAKKKELDDVAAWMRRIDFTREHDRSARIQYARDRRNARGDSGHAVDANIIGTYIDILGAFLYAKNPEVDIRPAPCAEPPTQRELLAAAEEEVGSNPTIRQTSDALGSDGAEAVAIGVEAQVQSTAAKLRLRYQRRLDGIKKFAESLEIVVSRLWHEAKLQKRGRRMTLGALTVGPGILKASWQQTQAHAPQTQQQIDLAQARLADAKRLAAELDDPQEREAEGTNLATLERDLAALKATPQRTTSRSYVIDVVRPEYFIVAPGYSLADHADAPWNAELIPMAWEEAIAAFGLSEDQVKQARCYTARTPTMSAESSVAAEPAPNPDMAEAFVSGAEGGEHAPKFMMVREIWDKASGHVLTGIEGIKTWVKPAFQPTPTSRFYGYFLLALSEVDGQRHPQSLVSRSEKLVEEYNRIGSAERKHRARSMPGVAFDSGEIAPEDTATLVGGDVGEWVPVKRTGNKPWSEIFFPKPQAAIDVQLYDRQRIRAELEVIWGVQEALSGTVQKAKTATEADIQQTGFNARTDSRRDLLETLLGELARYTAEVSRFHMTRGDVAAMVGPDAIWPEYSDTDDLLNFLSVEIRAGTSGKPNTQAERQSLQVLLPMLQQGAATIGQLRGAPPNDVADCLEELLRLAVERLDDRMDLTTLIPQVAAAAPAMPLPGAPMPGAPMPPPDPTVAAEAAPQPEGIV